MAGQRRVTEAAAELLRRHAARIAVGQSDDSAVEEELTAHLEDATLLLMEREGLPEAAAARQAISRFGGSEQIAAALANVHGTRVSWPRLLTAMALFVALNYLWLPVSAPWLRLRWLFWAAVLFTTVPQFHILRVDDEAWDRGRLPKLVSALWEYRLLLWPVVGVAWLVLPLTWLGSGREQMGAAPWGGHTANLVFLYLFTAMWIRFCRLGGGRGFLVWSSIVLAPILLMTLVQRSPLERSSLELVMSDILLNLVLIAWAWLFARFMGRIRENARFLSLRRPAGE